MTIRLEMGPEMEAELAKAAHDEGLQIDAYVKRSVEEALRIQSKPWRKPTEVEIRSFLDAMAYHGPIDPAMKTQAITREFIYGDHD